MKTGRRAHRLAPCPLRSDLAIILGVLHILSFPFGTALAVYTLWVLLSAETQPLFAT